MTKKHRIWELDALRGLCILGMMAVHLLFDLTGLYGTVSFQYPPWLLFLMDWGGVAFFLISGISLALMTLVDYAERKCMPYRHLDNKKGT